MRDVCRASTHALCARARTHATARHRTPSSMKSRCVLCRRLRAAPQRMLGSSCGVFALLGVSAWLKLEALARLLLSENYSEPWQWKRVLPQLVFLGLDACQIAALVLHERRCVAAGASTDVGHAGHLTGFAFGLLYGTARSVWRRMRCERERRRRLQNSGGRRLGGGGGSRRRERGH